MNANTWGAGVPISAASVSLEVKLDCASGGSGEHEGVTGPLMMSLWSSSFCHGRPSGAIVPEAAERAAVWREEPRELCHSSSRFPKSPENTERLLKPLKSLRSGSRVRCSSEQRKRRAPLCYSLNGTGVASPANNILFIRVGTHSVGLLQCGKNQATILATRQISRHLLLALHDLQPGRRTQSAEHNVLLAVVIHWTLNEIKLQQRSVSDSLAR